MARGRRPQGTRLGDVLVEHGLITREQLRAALRQQKASGGRLGAILVEQRILSLSQLNWALGDLLGVPYVELDVHTLDPAAVGLVPFELLRRCQAVPMVAFGNELTVALADPTDAQAVADIAAATGAEVKVAVADASAIDEVLAALATGASGGAPPRIQLGAAARPLSRDEILTDASGTTLVQHHLRQACEQGADELVLQPEGATFRVRQRLHGRWVDAAAYPVTFLPTVIGRVKLMTHMDLEPGAGFQERTVPLGGEGRQLEVAASAYSTVRGPGARLRIRARCAEPWRLGRLGLDEAALALLRRAAAAPAGLIAVCGPQRSGRTTTLHALLRETATPDRRVVTLETFASYEAADATQLETRDQAEFFSALAKVAQQPPDVLLAEALGQPRFWAAMLPQTLTGTLLLGEMRAGDAVTALCLLRESGVVGAMLSSALRLAVAQRLVPRLDPQAREPYDPPPAARDAAARLVPEAAGAQFFRAATDANGQRVFGGQELLCEVLEPDQDVRDLLFEGAPPARLREACCRAGLRPLRECSVRKAAQGLIELEEAP